MRLDNFGSHRELFPLKRTLWTNQKVWLRQEAKVQDNITLLFVDENDTVLFSLDNLTRMDLLLISDNIEKSVQWLCPSSRRDKDYHV